MAKNHIKRKIFSCKQKGKLLKEKRVEKRKDKENARIERKRVLKRAS